MQANSQLTLSNHGLPTFSQNLVFMGKSPTHKGNKCPNKKSEINSISKSSHYPNPRSSRCLITIIITG